MSRIVEPDFGLDAEGAGEDIGPAAGILAHVVGGHACESVTAQAIGARVADMQDMGDAAAQHHRGEGAAHAAQFVVAAALGKDPAVESIEDGGAGAADFHGFRQIAKAIKKAAHRGFRRHTATFGAADTIGNRGDDVAARLG